MRRYAFLILLTLIGLRISFFVWLHVMPTVASAPMAGDFINYWSAPVIAWNDAAVLFDLSRYHEAQRALYGTFTTWYNWSYPPHLLPLLAPLGFLPYTFALAVWSVLGLAAYLAIARVAIAREHRMAAYAFIVLSPASLMVLTTGQNGFFTAALFLGALYQLGTRPVLAGILLGLLTVKPQLGLLWPFILLALGAWRAIAAACVTTMLLIALSIALYGVEAWQGFFGFTLPYQQDLLTAPFLPRIYQLMMPALPIALQVLGVSIPSALTMQALLSGAIILCTVPALRSCSDFPTRAVLLTSGALLATPYALNYDMAALSLALLWRLLAIRARPLPLTALLCYGLALLLPSLVYVLQLAHIPLSPLIVIGVFLSALREAGQWTHRNSIHNGNKQV